MVCQIYSVGYVCLSQLPDELEVRIIIQMLLEYTIMFCATAIAL